MVLLRVPLVVSIALSRCCANVNAFHPPPRSLYLLEAFGFSRFRSRHYVLYLLGVPQRSTGQGSR